MGILVWRQTRMRFVCGLDFARRKENK